MKPITDEQIDQAVKDAGLTGPRVTSDDIDNVITGSAFHRFPDTTVTVCCLTLRNGYQVIGHSAAVSPDNFDANIGRQVAYQDAHRQIWALEGYLLRDRLANGTT